MAKGVTEKEIDTALDAFREEIKAWEILEFRWGGCIVTDRNRRLPVDLHFSASNEPITMTFTHHDFRTIDEAREFTLRQGMQAALVAYHNA